MTCTTIISAGDTAGLISAINAANGSAGTPDTICLTSSSYTITAVDNTTNGANGLPSITSDITIVGNGAVINRGAAAPAFRLFHVAVNGKLSLEDLTISGGNASGAAPADAGGAIYNRGTLILTKGSIGR